MLSRPSEKAILQSQRSLELALRQATIKAIRGALEESASSALLRYMNFPPPISADKIHARLYDLLDSGAIVLEKRIIAELYRQFDLHYTERPGFDFELMVAKGMARL